VLLTGESGLKGEGQKKGAASKSVKSVKRTIYQLFFLAVTQRRGLSRRQIKVSAERWKGEVAAQPGQGVRVEREKGQFMGLGKELERGVSRDAVKLSRV